MYVTGLLGVQIAKVCERHDVTVLIKTNEII